MPDYTAEFQHLWHLLWEQEQVTHAKIEALQAQLAALHVQVNGVQQSVHWTPMFAIGPLNDPNIGGAVHGVYDE